MTRLILENLPDELMEQIQQLAKQKNQTINDQAISLLQQALQKQTPLKFLISPETAPAWEERRQAVPQLQAQIDQRRRLNPKKHGFLDSTNLIREDRER
ncbi:MAG: hypothetical protein ACFB4I_03450 [Cyanophyceae cyanobacterium]